MITVKDDGSAVDISSASALQINIRQPSDEIINRAGLKKGDGSSVSGVMYYDTVAGDLNEIGNYKLQGKVILTAGTFYTDIHTFKVHHNL